MKSYGWTEDYVKFGLIGAKGWVYYNYAVENEARIWGNPVKPRKNRYVKQHWEKMLADKKK